MPEISVLIPVFNCEKYLHFAIESILNQTFQDFELIILDDCSNDNSFEIANSFVDNRIKVFKNINNVGIAGSRNILLSYASAKFIAWLDADDIAESNRLEVQYNYFQENKDITLIGSSVYVINEQNEILDTWELHSDCEYLKNLLILKNQFVQSSVMLNLNYLDIFHYDEGMSPLEDYALWFKLSRSYKVANLKSKLVRYRIHTTNNSFKNKSFNQSILKSIVSNILKYYKISYSNDDILKHMCFTDISILYDKKINIFSILAWCNHLLESLSCYSEIDIRLFKNILIEESLRLFILSSKKYTFVYILFYLIYFRDLYVLKFFYKKYLSKMFNVYT